MNAQTFKAAVDKAIAALNDLAASWEAGRIDLADATPAQTLDVATYYHVREAVRGWRHSERCEAEMRRAVCTCGLSALQGQIDRVPAAARGRVFTLRVEVPS